jgi:D-alanine-D-alanine ligase
MKPLGTHPVIEDAREFGRVAVLFGGGSAERDISLDSGHAVLAALQRRGVDAHGIDVGADIITRLQQARFDRAFIVLHGAGGEDGVMQALLQTFGIPYTGSGVRGSALAMDKVATKRLWLGCGLPTPPFVVLDGGERSMEQAVALGLPLIVKPTSEGSSIGMTRVEDAGDIHAAWEAAGGAAATVLAERWIHGGEYTVALVGGQVMPSIRVETPHVFYDFAAKYQADTTRYICPCGLPEEQEQALQRLATNAFAVLDCSGWGRVDLFVDGEGQAWLIEANTVPGMTDHSLVPMAARAAGIDFDTLVWRILETSFAGERR